MNKNRAHFLRFHYIFFVVTIATFVLVVPANSAANTSAVKEALDACESGISLVKQGNLASAEETLKKALAMAEQLPDKAAQKQPLLAMVCTNLALLFNDQTRYADAEVYFARALAIRDKLNTTTATKVVGLQNLATVYQNQRKYAQAEPLLQKALQLVEQSKKEDLELAERCASLGEIEHHLGKYTEAEVLQKRALRILEQMSPKSQEMLSSLTELATMYQERALWPEAEPYCQRALALKESLKGKDSPLLAVDMANLATINGKMGRTRKSIALLARAMVLARQARQPDELLVADLQTNLGSVCAEVGRYENATALIKQALVTREKKLGSEDATVGITLNDLGQVYEFQGKYDEAELLMNKGLSIVQTKLGANHPKTARILDALGGLYIDQEKFEQAEAVLNQSLKIREKLFGPDNPMVAQVLQNLADLRRKQGKLPEAEALYTSAATIWKNAYKEEHYYYQSACRKLVNVLIDEGKLERAATIMQEILAIDKRLTGEKSARVASDLSMLARIYQQQNKPKQERDTAQQADDIKKTLPGSPIAATENAKAPSIPNETGNKWALVIGISNFKDPAINLKYAAKDATDFANFLVKNEHFKSDHVRLLTDQKATRQNIVDALSDKGFASKAEKKDLMVIYFSSHGGKPMHDAGVNFVVPYDGNFRNLLTAGIPMEWLSQIVKEQVPCQRVVLVLDVCHSGAAAIDASSAERSISNSESDAEEGDGGKDLAYRRLNFDASRISAPHGQFVLCSSQANQRSWESKNYNNSVFTHWLMEGLKQKGNKTTLGDAYQFMCSRVEDEVLQDRGEQQTPLIRKSWQAEELVLGAP